MISPILVLAVMIRSRTTYWDDEAFREVSEGPSFEQVQSLSQRVETEIRYDEPH